MLNNHIESWHYILEKGFLINVRGRKGKDLKGKAYGALPASPWAPGPRGLVKIRVL